ncbi:MAG: HNH endonuclease [Dehalococcoidia bacterium]
MIDSAVLVLNQNYEPLNVCTVRRAFVLVDRGKAEILENGRGWLHSPTIVFAIPSVIRLIYLIRRPRPQPRLTRRDVFIRDGYVCQYCGRQTRDLTLDHVLPRRRGGEHVWENVAAACRECNHRKAGRTPQEARMHLRRQPKAPPSSAYPLFYPYLAAQEEWRKFIPSWQHDGGSW